jgi:hypothetical protein
VELATLYEFDENDRFFTAASCDPYMGHTLRLFTHLSIQRTQGWLLIKVSEVRIPG